MCVSAHSKHVLWLHWDLPVIPWCCRSEHWVRGSPFLISWRLVLLQTYNTQQEIRKGRWAWAHWNSHIHSYTHLSLRKDLKVNQTQLHMSICVSEIKPVSALDCLVSKLYEKTYHATCVLDISFWMYLCGNFVILAICSCCCKTVT